MGVEQSFINLKSTTTMADTKVFSFPDNGNNGGLFGGNGGWCGR